MDDFITVPRVLIEQFRGMVRGGLCPPPKDREAREGLNKLYRELDQLLGDVVPTAYKD